MSDTDVSHDRFLQEREARERAERLVEKQSEDLYLANRGLRRFAAALREQTTRAQTIVQMAAEGILTFNGNGLIESANPAAERIFGYPDDDLLGRRLGELVPAGLEESNPHRPCLENEFWTALPDVRRPARAAVGTASRRQRLRNGIDRQLY